MILLTNRVTPYTIVYELSHPILRCLLEPYNEECIPLMGMHGFLLVKLGDGYSLYFSLISCLYLFFY